MKKICHLCLSKAILTFTAIVFFTQLMVEVTKPVVREPGFEWIIPVCGGAVILAIIYYILALYYESKEDS